MKENRPKKNPTKKPLPCAMSYLDLLKRIARFARWEWYREEKSNEVIFQTRPTAIMRQSVNENDAPPDAPSIRDQKEIGIPIAVEMVDKTGNDPFSAEWAKMSAELYAHHMQATDSKPAHSDLPKTDCIYRSLCDSIGEAHDSLLVAYTSGEWRNVYEKARRFISILSVLRPIGGKPQKKQRKRAEGVTTSWIAAEFDQYRMKLIIDKKDVHITFEKREDGSAYIVGTCSVATIKKWLAKYPDEKNAEPKSGFHAGMLTNEEDIKKAAQRWRDYWQGYAKSFYKWRQTNRFSPRKYFRYNPTRIVHNVYEIC